MSMDNQVTGKFKFDINALIGLMILSLPLSIKIFFPSLNTEIIYPAEIFIGLIALLFFYNVFFSKQKLFFADKNFLRHPLTLLVFFYLAINILSAAFSTMHLVSLKAVTVKSCYILVFYFLLHALIKSSHNTFPLMFKIYGLGLILVTANSLIGQYKLGISDRGNAGFASNPFYNDHTIYSAALAFIVPSFISFSFFPKVFQITRSQLIPLVLATILFCAGLFFSFCRGAWVSVIAGIVLLTFILLRVQFYKLILLCITILLLIFFNLDGLIGSFKNNKIDGNVNNAGLYEQVFSLTNITNDQSNAERLNRWSCALRMFNDRTLLGFGPGTYQYQYIGYQRNKEMTVISINEQLRPGATSYSLRDIGGVSLPPGYTAQQGTGGSAHSEYFLALSETGIFSIIIFVGFFWIALFIGLRIISKSQDKKIKIIAVYTITGLATYFTHGVFNNFLDDCKLAFLFWSSLSALTTFDCICISRKENNPENSAN